MKIVVIVLILVVLVACIFFVYSRKNTGAKGVESQAAVVSRYYIGKDQVKEAEFFNLKKQLTIDASSEISSNFESQQGVYGGNEAHFSAKDQNGKTYTYSEMNFSDGSFSYILESK